jgi:hypothetical protein
LEGFFRRFSEGGTVSEGFFRRFSEGGTVSEIDQSRTPRF